MPKPQTGPMLPFGAYMPDRPDFGGGDRKATNVIPDRVGYRPFPDWTEYSSALNARCQGAIAVQDSAGVVYSFAGTASKLYIASNTSWTDATGSVTPACPSDGQWRFALFGETLIAVDGEIAPRKFALGSTTFGALGGSPPAAAEDVTVVRDFVVMSVGRTLYWSAINNAEGWTAGTNQSDTQTLPGEGSIIVRVIGGEFGTVLCKAAVYRMDYIGAPIIFQISRIEDARGCIAPNSAIKRGRFVYYLGDDGFYRFDGINSVGIGNDIIDKTFFQRIDPGFYDRIWAVTDPTNSLIIWGAPTLAQNIGGNIDTLFVFNESTGGWAEVDLFTSTASTGVELLWRDMSKGYTLDGLDSVSSTLDALPFSLDSSKWAGGTPALAAFSAAHKNGYFSGGALHATIDTTEAQLIPGMETFVSALRPIVAGTTSVTAQIGYRRRQQDSVTWSSAASLETNGDIPVTEAGVYLRARMLISDSNWDGHAQGFDAEYAPNGMP